MDGTAKRISRRALLKLTFAAGLGGGVLGGLSVVTGFLFPFRLQPSSRVRLGNVSKFPVGSKTLITIAEGRTGHEATLRPATPQLDDGGSSAEYRNVAIWLVRLEHGFLALSAKCTHLGAFVPWQANFKLPDPRTGEERGGWFRCPAHGATFNDDGVRVYGPAPRSLDRHDVRIIAGDVYVNAGRNRPGTSDNARYAVQEPAGA